jgi:hypothetical protein
MKPLPTIARVCEAFRLDASTGKLYNKASRRGARIGQETGTLYNGGYVKVCLDGRELQAHWVVFAIVHGRWPENELDHVNGVKSDNRPSNIREATSQQNKCNREAGSNSASGIKGVLWNKRERKWKVSITANSVTYNLGTFAQLEDAKTAHRNAAIKYHGDFARSAM